MPKKRHHTVPKSYLEYFTDRNGHVWVSDETGNVFNTHPDNVLVEGYFYAVTTKDGERSSVVEDFLEGIEARYINIFREKICEEKVLTTEERMHVAIFLAALFLRTKPRRESMRINLNNLRSSMEEWGKQMAFANPEQKKAAAILSSSSEEENLGIEDINDYLKELNEQHSLSVIDGLADIAQIIFDMKWVIYSSKDINLITCDNPVALLRPDSIARYGFKDMRSQPGFGFKDTEVTIPLSKDRFLLAGWILKEDSYGVSPERIALDINKRTIISTHMKVIASSESQIRDVKKQFFNHKQKQ